MTTAKDNPRAGGPYRYTRRRWHVVFAAIDRLGTLAMTAGRTLARLVGKRSFVGGSAPSQDAKVILLIQLDRLGDAIITTAMLPLLRQSFPDASIEVLAARWNCDMFRAAPQVDHVHVSGVNRFADGLSARLAWIPATLWWGWKLRHRKVDLGIDVRGEFPMALILWLCGARRRLGWDCGGGGFLLTDSPRYVPNRPELESRMALLAELGIEPSAFGRLDPPTFIVDEKSRRRIAEKLEGNERPLAVLHVGAGTPAKQWTAAAWRELLWRLTACRNMSVVLVGGNSDIAVAREILDDRHWPWVTDWTGRLSLAELAAVTERADVFIGADSGPAHLAAAVATPTVVLFSGTNDRRQWQPRGHCVEVVCAEVNCSPCHLRRCNRPEHPCMSRITPQSVQAVVEKIAEREHTRLCRKTSGANLHAPSHGIRSQ